MFRKYGLSGSLRMAINAFRTKLFYPSARLIRFPFEIRNKRFIDLGNQLTTGVGCRIEALPQKVTNTPCIIIGNDVQLNDYVHIGAIESIFIGNEVLIASKVFITDHNHGSFDDTATKEELLAAPIKRSLNAKPVKIGDKCWIGENVVILPGVELGAGCVVGASAVVTKSFPSYSLIIGNPARIYKRFNFETEKWELV
jgi:acetyltransferase-like isoleucine patch superfamily enzyme